MSDPGPEGNPARYVYGFVTAEQRAPDVAGIDQAPVELLADGDVAALTSVTSDDEVLPRRASLLAHAGVVDRAVVDGPVIPLRFGTVVPDTVALRGELLRPRHDELHTELQRLRDVVEVRVRGDYDESAVLADIVRRDREVARLRSRATSHADKVRLGELVTDRLQQLATRDAQWLLDRLGPLARDTAVHERRGMLELARHSFLVARADVAAFTGAVEELDGALGPVGDVRAVGPLAPHSFVDVGAEAAAR